MASHRITVSIPTFEPQYQANAGLEAWYIDNFDSWLDPEGDFEVTLILSDFASSETFKKTLRSYVDSRPGKVVLVDGAETTGSGFAANQGFRLVPYDVAVFAASDTRARDRNWANLLTADFEAPEVMAVFASTPIDGSHLVEQTQPEPIDRPSRRLAFPEGPIPNVVGFRRELLAPYGDRMTDVSLTDLTEGTMWQIWASGGTAVVSFRFNVLHDHYVAGGRYDRSESGNWIAPRRREEEALFRNIHTFLSTPVGHFDPAGHRPVLRPLIAGARNGGLRGIARAAYIRARRTRLSYIAKEIARHGFWRYLLQNRIARDQYNALMRLEPRARIEMVQSLFLTDTERYHQLNYSIHGVVLMDEVRP